MATDLASTMQLGFELEQGLPSKKEILPEPLTAEEAVYLMVLRQGPVPWQQAIRVLLPGEPVMSV